jgi:hypothetical protein
MTGNLFNHSIGASMIDHVGFAAANYERAKEFYARALVQLG